METMRVCDNSNNKSFIVVRHRCIFPLEIHSGLFPTNNVIMRSYDSLKAHYAIKLVHVCLKFPFSNVALPILNIYINIEYNS